MEAERMLRILCHLGFAVSLAALPLTANAQSATPGEQQIAAGNELLAAGKTAYAESRFAQALEDFEQAYQRTQRPSILYRIGDTADKLGQHERAVTAFQSYLDAVPKATDADFIRSRIAANREALRVGDTAPTSHALSPQAAALAGTAADADPSAPAAVAPSDGTDLKRAWWLWAGGGTLVVATIVIVAVLVGSSSTHQVAPVKGNVGGTVRTLEGP
jgi:tetratricopeptide (TPR) repeat protein